MTNNAAPRTIAVYGATSHTAGYLLPELARRGVTTILLGRNADRLHAAAAGLPGAQVRVAKADDRAALVAAFTGADAVVSSLPAYVERGDVVLSAAIEAGAHYVDISGEQLWVDRVQREFAESAENAGVTVIPAITDSNLPGDLLAYLAVRTVGGPARIVLSHNSRSGGDGSRGSAQTVLASLDWFRSGGWHFANDGLHTGPIDQSRLHFPGEAAPASVGKFPNTPVLTIPRHTDVSFVAGVLKSSFLANLSGFTAELIDTLPEKPSPASDLRYDLVVDATGTDGRTARGVLHGLDSYRDSALMAAEAAIRLAGGDAKPGVLSPAEAFEAAEFLDALAVHGITWAIGHPTI